MAGLFGIFFVFSFFGLNVGLCPSIFFISRLCVRAMFQNVFSSFSGSVAAFEPLRFDSVDLGHRP